MTSLCSVGPQRKVNSPYVSPVRLAGAAILTQFVQIRVYGMTHYNESSDYWGNRVNKLIGAGNGRLTARSVKIFADGMHPSILRNNESYSD